MIKRDTLAIAANDSVLKGPIGRKAVSELVVQRVLNLIKNGQLDAGEKLPSERSLATMLDVSRPTVREALRALSILGVLEIRHGGGVFVTSLDASELLNPLDFFVSLNAQNMTALFDARIEYEPMIVALATPRFTDDELANLQELVDAQQENTNDAELFHDTDVEFHKLIIEASGNMFLARVGKTFQVLSDQARREFQKNDVIRHQSIADHVLIMQALARRNPEQAAEAMRQHIKNVRNGLTEIVSGRR